MCADALQYEARVKYHKERRLMSCLEYDDEYEKDQDEQGDHDRRACYPHFSV